MTIFSSLESLNIVELCVNVEHLKVLSFEKILLSLGGLFDNI